MTTDNGNPAIPLEGSSAEEWLVTVDDSTLALVRLEKLGPRIASAIDLIVTIDQASGYPLKLEVRDRDGSRRDLNAAESGRLTEAYAAAAEYWQSYYAGYTDTVAASNIRTGLSPEESAYYRQTAMPTKTTGEA